MPSNDVISIFVVWDRRVAKLEVCCSPSPADFEEIFLASTSVVAHLTAKKIFSNKFLPT
jgi:hypothetical protein